MNALAKSDETELIIFESDLSIEKAFTGTYLRVLQKTDKRSTIKTLVYIISRMNDSYNMNLKLNDNQTLQLAVDLLDVFRNESIEDIILMFKYARQGKIGGKIFKLDSQTIFNSWVPSYLELKAIERERRIAQNKLEQHKIERDNKNEENVPYHPRVVKEFSKLQKKIQKKRTEKRKIIGHHMTSIDAFVEHLPETCKYLTDEQLQKEIKKAEYQKMTAAVNIYMTEVKIRIEEKQKQATKPNEQKK